MLISFTLFFSLNSKSTHSFAFKLIFLVKFSKKNIFYSRSLFVVLFFRLLLQFCRHFLLKIYHIHPIRFRTKWDWTKSYSYISMNETIYTDVHEMRFAFCCHHLKKDELLQAISIAGLLCMHSWMNSEHHKFSNWVWISADPGLIKLTKQIWWLCCALLRMSLRILRLMIATKMAAMIRFLCEMVKKLTSLKDLNSLYQTEISKFNEGVWMKLCVNRNWLFIYYILHYD